MYSTNPLSILDERVVLAMVGLPARGKSYISKAIIRYLHFLGCEAELFNSGNKRRTEGMAGADANFFDATNASAKEMRDQLTLGCLDELLTWINECVSEGGGCACGILDATNTTKVRRKMLMDRCSREDPPVQLVFLELICDDEEILSQNYRLKLANDDYKGRDAQASIDDFLNRVKQYELVYEQIEDDESFDSERIRYIKMVNAGRKLIVANGQGHVHTLLVGLLHSIQLGPRIIWFVLAGETINDMSSVLGGDSPLSSAGQLYTTEVSRLILEREKVAVRDGIGAGTDRPRATLMCGTLQRYGTMARLISAPTKECTEKRKVLQLQRLNELCAGSLDSLTYEEMQTKYPKDYAARAVNKLTYRFPGPGGESYFDVILRLQEFILFLEQLRHDTVLVLDRAVHRVITGYFLGVDMAELPHSEVKPGLLELRRSHSGFRAEHFLVEAGAVTRAAGPGTDLGEQHNVRAVESSVVSP